MNAEEARKKSLETSNEEIEKIKFLIEQAVKQGKMSVEFEMNHFLKEGTINWLKENGYKYHEDKPSYERFYSDTDGRFSNSIHW
jgi:hypothetical protein